MISKNTPKEFLLMDPSRYLDKNKEYYMNKINTLLKTVDSFSW